MFRFFFFLFISFNLFGQDTKLIEPTNTGVNMTIALMEISDSFCETGDTVLTLYKVDNQFAVGGLAVWQGTRLAIAVWGNDSTSDKKDGFFDNESINWILRKDGQNIFLKPHYRVGENLWKANGISIIDSLTVLN